MGNPETVATVWPQCPSPGCNRRLKRLPLNSGWKCMEDWWSYSSLDELQTQRARAAIRKPRQADGYDD